MLTHSHYCKATDRTWSCTDANCGQEYLVTFAPTAAERAHKEALRMQTAREKREFMLKFNANMRLLKQIAYRK
jgi:hypothetical protein